MKNTIIHVLSVLLFESLRHFLASHILLSTPFKKCTVSPKNIHLNFLIFWVRTRCIFLDSSTFFWLEQRGSKFLANVGTYIPNYTYFHAQKNVISTFKPPRERHILGFSYINITRWSRYSITQQKFISKLITPHNANNTSSRLVKLLRKEFSDCWYRF
jgi:hypothetical protein